MWAPTELSIPQAMQPSLDGASILPFPHVVSSTSKSPLTLDLPMAGKDQLQLGSLKEKSTLTWSFICAGSCKNLPAPLLGPDRRVP